MRTETHKILRSTSLEEIGNSPILYTGQVKVQLYHYNLFLEIHWKSYRDKQTAPGGKLDSEGCNSHGLEGSTEATGGWAWREKILAMLQMT